MALVIHVDGGARGNPGPAGAGVVIADSGGPVFEAGFFLGAQTNNAAEYMALIHALRHVESLGVRPLMIRCDSELIVRQITGVYRVKSPALRPLHEQVQMLLLRVPRWQIEHVRREQNARADELANMAMDRGGDVIVLDTEGIAGGGDTSSGEATSGTAGGEAATGARASDGPADAAAPGAVIETSSGVRAVQVIAERTPSPGACPAGSWECKSFVVGATLPPGVCVHAAHALLPTVLAVQNTSANEAGAIPTMTVRCSHAECGAVFHVGPHVSGNGRP